MKNDKQNLIDDLAVLTKSIHGWTVPDELAFLYKTARLIQKNTGEGVIVEIGSWQGRSTVCLALGALEGGGSKVYAIDPFTGSSENQIPGIQIWTFDDFKKNLATAGVQDAVVPFAAASEDVAKTWDKPIDFLFIDGAHEEAAVERDFLLYAPHLVRGGTIAFHDVAPHMKAILRGSPLFGLPGPRAVAEKYIFKSRAFKNLGLVGSVLYANKCSNNSILDRWQNRMCWLHLRLKYLIYAAYSRLKTMPQPVKFLLKPFKDFLTAR